MAIFWDASFAFCYCQIIKLTFKLGLKMKKIANVVVKEKIYLVWANKILNQLDQLFLNNPEYLNETIIIYVQSSAKT